MAKFLNNEPKFKVGDKVIYSRRCDFMEPWEKESICRGPLAISRVDKLYNNDELTGVTYFVEGLAYAYREDWLSYAPAGPKFKIGDKVDVEFIPGGHFRESGYQVEDILTIRHQKDGHEEYLYRITGWPFGVQEKDLKLYVTKEEDQLIHDLEICGEGNGCDGCSRGRAGCAAPGCCSKLELDAVELIKKLQNRVKELEDKK